MNYKGRVTYSNFSCFKKHRECYGNSTGINDFQSSYMNVCFNLYSRKLFGHYGCVNAIEFSNRTSNFLASGGDDKRVLLWNVNECLFNPTYKPVAMMGTHISNIFCIAFTADNSTLLSSGNDEQVMIHDVHTRQVRNVYLRDDAVYSISAHPNDPNIFITASEDGKLRLTDMRYTESAGVCLANYVSAFHGVTFNPMEPLFVAAAHCKEGAALWDVRKPKSTLLCYGSPLSRESTMSVQFNQVGSRLLVLRRKKSPRVYKTYSDIPFVDGDSDRYFNSCTMKSGCFAGVNDEYFVSGSDDFKVYVWKIPQHCEDEFRMQVIAPRMVLRGHRSIVNQVRFNKQTQTLVSSGVEKSLNLWSPFKYPQFMGQNEEPSFEQTRAMYSRHQYIDLVLRSGTTLTHDYESENVEEDPRMIAFFDSLLQHDQNHNQSSGENSDDDESIVNLRMLPQIMASIRPDGRDSTSSFVTSTSDDSTNDEGPGLESVQQAMQSQSTIDKQTQTRLHSLRASLRSDDDAQVTSTSGGKTAVAQQPPTFQYNSTKITPKDDVKSTARSASSDGSDTNRRSAMRKRNAGRRKRKRIKSDPQSGVAAPRSSGTKKSCVQYSDTSSESESDYVRTKRKLRHSMEATSRRLQNIADEMATAIERASKDSDSDNNENNFNNSELL